jgi:sensitive to high expression protein 9
MPPPPELVQQRIDAAILDAARSSRSAPPRKAAPELKPASVAEEQPAEPAPTTAAPDTQDPIPRAQEAPIEGETAAKTDAEVVAEKVAREEAVTEEALPSKHQEQRWHMSKRVQQRMDELLAKAAVVSHKVNNYTGTDYSGIERLRREIIDQGKFLSRMLSMLCMS